MCGENCRVETVQLLWISGEESKEEDWGKYEEDPECEASGCHCKTGGEVEDEDWKDSQCVDSNGVYWLMKDYVIWYKYEGLCRYDVRAITNKVTFYHFIFYLNLSANNTYWNASF